MWNLKDLNRTKIMQRLWPVFVVLVASLTVYLLYFTPEKRSVRKRLAEADTKSKVAINTRLKPVNEVFARARKGAKTFAKEALSWEGKWEFVKGLTDDGESHRRYMNDLFVRYVLNSDELRMAMESAVQSYLDDIETYEAEMLVALRADLTGPVRPSQRNGKNRQADEALRTEYLRLSGLVAKQVQSDVEMTVGREVGMLVVSEVATQSALHAAKAAATELGISAGILGTGAASTVATLGLGMVIAIILDSIVDEIFKIAGYDPAVKIEGLVVESLNRMEGTLLRGPDLPEHVKGGALRQRMEELHENRSRLRGETMKKLLKEGGLK